MLGCARFRPRDSLQLAPAARGSASIRGVWLVLASLGLLVGVAVAHDRPTAHPSQAAIPAGNLLKNPGAEAGVGGSGEVVGDIPAWSRTSNFTVVRYGSSGYPTAGGGSNFFAGGNANTESSAVQTILVEPGSDLAKAIDAGSVDAKLSAMIGGYAEQADSGTISVKFMGGGAKLGGFTIGPVTVGDRGMQTKLLPREAAGRVPSGTREFGVTMRAVRSEGDSNDGYFDDVSLELSGSAAPPPTCTPRGASAFAALKYCPFEFGAEATVRAPDRASTVDISPEPMPASADEVLVALRELILEEEANELIAVVRLELQRHPGLTEAFHGCMLIGEGIARPEFIRVDAQATAVVLLRACNELLVASAKRPSNSATGRGSAAADGCEAGFVPAFPKGRKVTKRKRKRAVAAARQQIAGSCKQRRVGRLSFSIRARGKGVTLPDVTGRQLRVKVARRVPRGAPDQRLGVRWRARKR